MTFNRSIRVQFPGSFIAQLFIEYPPERGTVLDARRTAVNITDKHHLLSVEETNKTKRCVKWY